MTPGPNIILMAPGCKKPLKISTIASGNTFGATFWTDGKCEAPMLPDEPWLRKSPAEGVLFWTDECEELGAVHFFDSDESTPGDWEKLEYAEEPTEEDYLAALNAGVADTPEKLRYLRMRLWWLGNDPIRKEEQMSLSAPHLDNLGKLIELLSEDDPNQRLMRAEAFRELGRFGEALKLLEFDYPKGYSTTAARIRMLAGEGVATVSTVS